MKMDNEQGSVPKASNVRDVVSYHDSRIALLDDMRSFESHRLNVKHYVCFFCTQGSATISNSQGRRFEAGVNDVFLCHPNQMLEYIKTSIDFNGFGMVFSPDFLNEIMLLSPKRWEYFKLLESMPVLHLTQEEVCDVRTDFDYMLNKLRRTPEKYRGEVIECLVKLVTCCGYDAIFSKLEGLMPEKLRYTSGEILAQRFVEMVTELTPKVREVGTYAERLCVTPKYLSAICKRELGVTARDVINGTTARRIRSMLRDPSMTVKQVAAACGIDNLSFFGKYVKRELGLSPREFRRSAQGE